MKIIIKLNTGEIKLLFKDLSSIQLDKEDISTSMDTSAYTINEIRSKRFKDTIKSINANSIDVIEEGLTDLFNGYFSLVSLDLNKWDASNITYMINMIKWCSSLVSLDIYNVTEMSYMFMNCASLVDLKFGKNLKLSLDLSDCPLTHESAISVIDGLAKVEDNYQYITFSKEVYKLLTAEDCKKLFDKNWICSASSTFDNNFNFINCSLLTVTNVLYYLAKTSSAQYIFISNDIINDIDNALIEDTLRKGFIIIAIC